MTPAQKIALRQSEIRQRLTAMLDTPDWTDEIRAEQVTLKAELSDLETRAQTALLAADGAAPDATAPEVRPSEDGEAREIRQLRANADFANYISASLEQRGVTDGAEAELNAVLNVPMNRFPMEMLVAGLEERAAIDGDSATNQGSWLDRLFAGSAAEAVGISFRTVAPGIASYPVTSAGGTGAQRGRAQDAAISTYSATVTEMKPKRNAIHGVYQIEDDARLPGLADAIRRDMASAMVATIDKTVFVGDTTANPNEGDIVGLQTAGIDEETLTQLNKVKADEVLKLLVGYVDGIHAMSPADLRIVATVGSNVLWSGQVHAATVSNQTIAQFLAASGIVWTVKGDVEANSANGDFGAFVGLGRGIDGAGIAAVWDSGALIIDPYSGAKGGSVALTLNYLWDFALPRTANFKRLKYVA